MAELSDKDLLKISIKDLNKLINGRSDEQDIRKRRTTLKRKQYTIKTRSAQKQAMKLRKELVEKTEKIAATKPSASDWRKVSEKHRGKFKQLLTIWEKNEPESMTIVNDNGACFKKEFLIGNGSYGTEVYICLGADGIERAIKRLPKLLCQKFLKNERDILTSKNAVESPRVVNYYFYDDISHPDFGYLILSLHEQNLEDYIKEKGDAITESRARKMIRQVLQGLKTLHTREPRILHRDLKPTNILVDKKGDLVLSDFGIGRFFPEQGATTYNTSNESGSRDWIAHECIDWSGLYTNELKDPSDEPLQLIWKEKSDIQVAGMLGFYILTKGKHPFGPEITRLINLANGKPVSLDELHDPVVKDLLSQMLARNLDKRPYVEQALKHPYLLYRKEQIQFLKAMGNEPKSPDFCDVSSLLDDCHPSKHRSPLLEPNWKSVIDSGDLETLCKGGRKSSGYKGKRYTHCLRLIRNVLEHPGDKLRRLVDKGQATSLGEYFLDRFPNLPLVVHQIIRKYPDWKKRPALKEFFPEINRRAVSNEDMDED